MPYYDRHIFRDLYIRFSDIFNGKRLQIKSSFNQSTGLITRRLRRIESNSPRYPSACGGEFHLVFSCPKGQLLLLLAS
jgi:hypothetical protein